ncbi:MAG: FtsW/RodA/SpoVE family cell cycle protein [Bacteroidia bacterium]
MQSLLHKIKLRGDRTIWLIVGILTLASMLVVYSSTGTLAYKARGGNTEYFLIKHSALAVFGLIVMYFVHHLPYRYFSRIAQILLFLSIPLLVYTLIKGTSLNEASRWITIPLINQTFQSSDLAKLALFMYLARTLARKQDEIKSWSQAFLPVIAPVFIISFLIAPANLSTAMLVFFTSLMVMFIGRISMRQIGLMLAVGSLVLGSFVFVSYQLGWFRAKTWVNRVETFVAGSDKEEAYQTQQAKIAIATGGLLGKGPGKSTQRNFLPHPYSDFIYATILEEYGLLGGAFVVLLYLGLLYRVTRIVIRAPQAFGALLAIGLCLMLVIQAMVNMAVAVNLFPVTGQTLPLLSMGGTSIIFTSIAFGIILSVSREIESETQEYNQTENSIHAAA